MKNSKRMPYSAPTVEVVVIMLEHGIAAGSADINSGNQTTPNTPKVEDWTDSGFQSKDFDLL